MAEDKWKTNPFAKKYKAKLQSKAKARALDLEKRSKKAGFYVHGHKNLGDVYEA